MRHIRTIAVAAALVLGAGMLPAAAEDGAGTGTLSIRATFRGSPAAGFPVSVTSRGDGWVGTTNADGVATIEVPVGEFTVGVEPNPKDGVDTTTTFAEATVTAGATTDVPVAVAAGGAISGKVLSTAGKAVKGKAGVGDWTGAGPWAYVRADAQGRFRIGDLRPGEHSLNVAYDGVLTQVQKGRYPRVFIVKAGSTTKAGSHRVVKQTGTFKGVIRTKTPLTYSVFQAFGDRLEVHTGRTDRNGRLVVRNLPAGTYSIYVKNRGVVRTVKVRAGKVVTFTKVNASKSRVGRVLVRLEDGTGKLVKAGSAEFFDAKQRRVASAGIKDGRVVDRKGKRGIVLPKGTYTMVLHVRHAKEDLAGRDTPPLHTLYPGRALAVTTKVKVATSKTTVVRKALTRGGTVTGRLVRAGKPIVDHFVTVGGVAAETDEDGRFTAYGVEPGRRTVFATLSGEDVRFTKKVTVTVKRGATVTVPRIKMLW